MEPENIDWNNIESIFIEDDTYENFDAPKWVDLSAPDEPIDDQSWFCNPGCKHKHPKNAEDLHIFSKVKLLRSLAITEILPFKDRSRRDVKLKEKEINSSSAAKLPVPKSMKPKGSNSSHNINEDSENKNPNFSANGRTNSKKAAMKPSTERNKQFDESLENSSKGDRKPQLKSTFSARNLLGGREILNQITEFCAELKKLAMKGSKKEAAQKRSGGVLGELKERVRDREKMKMPLLVVKEGES